jgi:FlaA1/EpsC-like NDP-sugar epimerase
MDTILITGAAGSIGSELARQLVSSSYKRLILVDIAESPLYSVFKEFEHEDVSKIEFLLLNITEKDSVEYLFETYKPTLIFHAAAYKHVPLMEEHPYEAIKTNILATVLLADLSIKYNVKKFIFISTDKAVNPISVLGMSKNIAENYLTYLSQKNVTDFSITRFGNILGSNGSVLPLFIKQIEAGLPLTITSKTVTRYFINKKKACHLILQIATFNRYRSGIFTFNMGKPIKVIDLAKSLISIYEKHNETIKIKITGLRPGEKLHEAMIWDEEELLPTENKDILLVNNKNKLEYKSLDFNPLINVTPYHSPQDIKAVLLKYI